MAIYDVLRHQMYDLPIELVERDDFGRVLGFIVVDRSGVESREPETISQHHHPDSDKEVQPSSKTYADELAHTTREIEPNAQPRWPFGFTTIKDAVEETRKRIAKLP